MPETGGLHVTFPGIVSSSIYTIYYLFFLSRSRRMPLSDREKSYLYRYRYRAYLPPVNEGYSVHLRGKPTSLGVVPSSRIQGLLAAFAGGAFPAGCRCPEIRE
jgi:hypothetical protein